jgi:hypothetical protein
MADNEDYLSEDPEISSQKIVLLSFLSPEKILANKEQFLFKKFLSDYNLQWRTKKLEVWLAAKVQEVNSKLDILASGLERQADLSGSGSLDISGLPQKIRDSCLRVDRMVEDFQQHVRKNLEEIQVSDINREYDDFIFEKSSALEEEFFAANDFKTTIRGIKVRGVFSSEAEASVRAKRLQRSDPNFNIYMGSVGKWMAWEPEPGKVTTQEYANEQLNTLMKKYKDNEEARETFYNEQKTKRVGTARTRDVTSTGLEGNFDSMFSGPADLAISRKAENSSEAKEAKEAKANANAQGGALD